MKKIMFINPPSPDGEVVIRDFNRSGRKTRENIVWCQVGLATLAGMVKNHKVKILDCIGSKMGWEEFRKELKLFRPDYVVVLVVSATLTNDMRAIFLAKSMGAVTIGIGPHLTDLWRESLTKFPCLDYIIRGEPEITLRELLKAVEAMEDLRNIDGIAYYGDGPVKTQDREFMDLRGLPSPLYYLLPLENYTSPFLGKYAFVITHRGCPFSCIFCRQTVMWKSKVRCRPITSVIRDMQYLRSRGVNNIMMYSDTFTADRQWVLDLCNHIHMVGGGFKWCCNTHIKLLDEELAHEMKKAGCWMIAPGIESGSDDVLEMCEKKITVKEIEEKILIIKDAGMEAWGYFIFGLPGETKETIEKTIKLSLKLPLDMANFAIASPYPGTRFYSMAMENGWLLQADWEQYDQNKSAVVQYKDLSAEDIINATKRANLLFFRRPSKMWRIFKELLKNKDTWKIIQNHKRWIDARD